MRALTELRVCDEGLGAGPTGRGVRPGEDDALPAMSAARRPHCRVRPARERALTLREAANAFLAQPDLAASSRRSYAQTRTSVSPLSPWAAGEGRSPPRLTGTSLRVLLGEQPHEPAELGRWPGASGIHRQDITCVECERSFAACPLRTSGAI